MKKLILDYIKLINKEDINKFANKNNITLSSKEINNIFNLLQDKNILDYSDDAYLELINNNILTGEEQEIVRKGRNAPSHKSKSTDIVTYHKATGFECLIGYLYQNNKDRLEEIMKGILK